MPWREIRVQKQRLELVEAYRSGQASMSELCRQFGVSRKTGFKYVRRFQEAGLGGLEDYSRAPHLQPLRVSSEVEERILDLRRGHPTWGPLKLRHRLQALEPDEAWPCKSTIHNILSRNGLIAPRRRRRRATPSESPLGECLSPNDVWCIDFKGWFRTGDRHRCDPLTVTDGCSRYLLECRALSETSGGVVQRALIRAFREYGLPIAIRSDNGSPFSCARALGGLSRFSVWLVRLGVILERIEPGEPQQNGRHERFHRTLKREAIQPPRKNLRAQQEAFRRFRREYNEERPHESLGGKTPSEVYERSSREYPRKLEPVEYPREWTVRKVSPSGWIKLRGEMYFLTEALAGEEIGLERVGESRYSVQFGPLELGLLEERTKEIRRHRRLKYREGASPMCLDNDASACRQGD